MFQDHVICVQQHTLQLTLALDVYEVWFCHLIESSDTRLLGQVHVVLSQSSLCIWGTMANAEAKKLRICSVCFRSCFWRMGDNPVKKKIKRKYINILGDKDELL